MAGCTVKKVLSKIRAFDGAPFFYSSEIVIYSGAKSFQMPVSSYQKSQTASLPKEESLLPLPPDQNSMLETNVQSWVFPHDTLYIEMIKHCHFHAHRLGLLFSQFEGELAKNSPISSISCPSFFPV
jgi:hypothetical protein